MPHLKLILEPWTFTTHDSYLQRKNDWRAENLNATNVAKTLTFFFKREKDVESVKKKHC